MELGVTGRHAGAGAIAVAPTSSQSSSSSRGRHRRRPSIPRGAVSSAVERRERPSSVAPRCSRPTSSTSSPPSPPPPPLAADVVAGAPPLPGGADFFTVVAASLAADDLAGPPPFGRGAVSLAPDVVDGPRTRRRLTWSSLNFSSSSSSTSSLVVVAAVDTARVVARRCCDYTTVLGGGLLSPPWPSSSTRLARVFVDIVAPSSSCRRRPSRPSFLCFLSNSLLPRNFYTISHEPLVSLADLGRSRHFRCVC